jgi:probable F420-dependent oxidoreductase
MKIGLFSLNCDYGLGPAEMARDLEERGYESLWVGEHTHIPASRDSPYPRRSGELPRGYWHIRDPFISLAMAATVTTRLRLGTSVCLVLEHQVLDLAKSVATLDQMSGGRFLFGVGVGWNREELANVSAVPWPRRYDAMRETIAAMRELWANDEAGYDGDYVKFSPSWAFPKPTSRSGPPVLLGCQGPTGLPHVASYADEWLPREGRFDDVGEGVRAFRETVLVAGRDPDAIPISMLCFAEPSAATIEAYARLGIHRLIFYAPDEANAHRAFVDRCQPLVDEFASR